MAAAFASRGFNVVGMDLDPVAVSRLNEGHAPAPEAGLEELVAANRSRLKGTLDCREAILHGDICFVIVPTPSDERGAFSLEPARKAFAAMGRALAEKQGYTLIVLTSTVLPGACRYGLVPILERESGKKAGVDFGFCYSPEFIALGSVIQNFLNPDFTLVGEWDARSGAELEALYAQAMPNHAPCKRMSLENAELAKVSLNSYVTMKITFANTLAEICQRMPGGDVDAVTGAIGADSRIGGKFFKGGVGFGGPCFPRDNVAFGFIARQMGVEPDLAAATDRLNERWLEASVERVRALTPKGGRVAVLGLAYKPGTPVVERSQSLALAARLAQEGFQVTAFDPMAGDWARKELPEAVRIADSIPHCLEGAHLVAVTTMHAEFRALAAEDFRGCAQNAVVYDLWRMLEHSVAGRDGLRWVPYGREQQGGALADTLDSLWNPVASR
jgi:UDPglucose 6-dehydrogenase